MDISSADDLERLGLVLLFGENHRILRRKECYRKKVFRCHYGHNPSMGLNLWNLIKKDKWLNKVTGSNPPNVDHFLWSLYFMYIYDTETRSASRFKCDEKTWRKWTWTYAIAMSRLVKKLVSFNSFFLTEQPNSFFWFTIFNILDGRIDF